MTQQGDGTDAAATGNAGQPGGSGAQVGASAMGVTPRFSPRGARELIDDIDLLLDHLGRAMPGRLEACFDDSRGTTARGAGIADPPRVLSAGAAGEAAGSRTKAAFIEHLAEIARRAAVAAAEGDGVNTAWNGFTRDLAFLIQARDFLATLAQPATVDTIRLTRAYVNETIRWRKGRIGRRDASARPPEDGAADTDASSRNHAEIGLALAVRMRRLRRWSTVCVVVTLLVSLYAFTGKVLLEEGERSRAFLGKVNGEIAAVIAAEAQSAQTAIRQDAFIGSTPASFAVAYCDRPFLDDDGLVRYASTRQEELCNRLWGANGYVNRLSRHLDVWSAPFVHTPLGWFFGLVTVPDPLRRVRGWFTGEAEPGRSPTGGAVRVFAENARPAGFADARRLASEREPDPQARIARLPSLPAIPRGGDGGNAGIDPGAGAPAEARSTDSVRDPVGGEVSEIVRKARERFDDLGYLKRDYLLHGTPTTPLQATAVIEGVGLYVMPCLYALLGAFVAVFRNIARKGDTALLDRFDHDKVTQTISLGVVFGAVVGLLADMLKGGGAAGQPAEGATIVLGVSALALLAGYSVGHVFGLLDDISERVFGRRDAGGRLGA